MSEGAWCSDDVSQEAWAIVNNLMNPSEYTSPEEVARSIDSAIMAAKAEERSGIISIIERFSKATKDTGHFEYEDRLMRGVLARVVDAINSST